MSASAETFCHAGDVDLPFASQTDAISTIRQLAEEGCDFHTADGQDVIHQSFTVFFDGATPLHLLLCDPDVADVTLKVEIAQGFRRRFRTSSLGGETIGRKFPAHRRL